MSSQANTSVHEIMPNLRKHTLRQQLSAGPIVGTFAAIPHPVAVEVAGSAGFDFLILDAEHSQLDRSGIENLLRAADAVGTSAIVRVPGSQPEWISSVLDAGASGVLVPRISTAAQARAVVAATRYPPIGERGVGPGRASHYGSRIPEYLQDANQTLLLAIQVESVEAVANIEEIAAVSGIDLIFIGPGDLSVSIAARPAPGLTLEAAVSKVIATCARHERPVGIFMADATQAQQWVSRGVRLLVIAADSMFLHAGATAAAAIGQAAKVGTQGPTS
jgi:4-hydroxy-2-oxoheptanedioate aldolase